PRNRGRGHHRVQVDRRDRRSHRTHQHTPQRVTPPRKYGPSNWRIPRRSFLGTAIAGTLLAQRKFSRPPDAADIPYGKHKRNALDIGLAESAQPAPLVIYFQSGLFSSGDKSELDPVLLDRLLAGGISVAAVNHRYSLEKAPFPFPMWDCVRAVQFLRM